MVSKKNWVLLIFAPVMLLLMACHNTSSSASQPDNYVQQVIVKPQQGVTLTAKNTKLFFKSYPVDIVFVAAMSGQSYLVQVKSKTKKQFDALLRRLNQDSRINYAEANKRVRHY